VHFVYELCLGFRMTTKTSAEDKKDIPTSSVIMMKASTVSDETFSFPQNDSMEILMKDEKATSTQDRQAMEDDEKRRKKELNRLAAQRSREKRRQLIKQLEEQVDELEKCNDSMTCEITEMKDEITQLDFLLQNHVCTLRQ